MHAHRIHENKEENRCLRKKNSSRIRVYVYALILCSSTSNAMKCKAFANTGTKRSLSQP